MRLEIAGEKFIEETGIKAVPILQIIGDADVYCVNKKGKIVQYHHEENDVEEIKIDFWELFETELKNLKERKEMKIKERK
jgi:DNA-directed RNA polymerase beta' subunit